MNEINLVPLPVRSFAFFRLFDLKKGAFLQYKFHIQIRVRISEMDKTNIWETKRLLTRQFRYQYQIDIETSAY